MTVVVHVRADGGAAVAPQAERLAIGLVPPVDARARQARTRDTSAARVSRVALAVTAGELVVRPVLIRVERVTRCDGAVVVRDGPGPIACALPQQVRRTSVGRREQLGGAVGVEVARHGRPGATVRSPFVQRGLIGPRLGRETVAGGLVVEKSGAVAFVQTVFEQHDTTGPRRCKGALRDPQVDEPVAIDIGERRARDGVLDELRPQVAVDVGETELASAVVEHQLAGRAGLGTIDPGGHAREHVEAAVVVHVRERDDLTGSTDVAGHHAAGRTQSGLQRHVFEAALPGVAHQPGLPRS